MYAHSGGLDGSVALWSTSTGELQRRLCMPAGVSAIAAHPSRAAFFVCGTIEGKVRSVCATTQEFQSVCDAQLIGGVAKIVSVPLHDTLVKGCRALNCNHTASLR